MASLVYPILSATMRAPVASSITMKPSAQPFCMAFSRGTWRVEIVIQSLSWRSIPTKLTGGRATPSTSARCRRASQSGRMRQTPPSAPRLAIIRSRLAISAMPFGRKPSGTPRALASRCAPSAPKILTPPRASDTKSSPDRVASTHSGRCSPLPMKLMAPGSTGSIISHSSQNQHHADDAAFKSLPPHGPHASVSAFFRPQGSPPTRTLSP